ncbi:cupin domain-containing protein [Micromonospora sp. SH-82]|uniref:cupin domain-containing protein n=1 Tax=Micromonospora sp. SH-82 TaxID=3132938 RepID=UPI003EBF7070
MPSVLAQLVADPDKFLARPPTEATVWHQPAEPLTAVLSLESVDTLVAEGSLRAAMLSVVLGGQRQPATAYTWGQRPTQPGFADVVRPAELTVLLDRGATLVLESLHRTWPPVGHLCRQLSREIGMPVQANAYLTPAGAQGFAHHHDTHSVLIVQTVGSKTWQVSPPIVTDPLEHQPFRASMVTDEHRRRFAEPVLEVVLRRGDVLWVPRGWIHNGFATDEASLHLSLSLPPITPYWVATELVRGLDVDERFRRDLPWGFGQDPQLRREVVAEVVDLLAEALADLDRTEAADRLAQRWRRYFLEPQRRPVETVLGAPVGPDTAVRSVPEAVCGTDRLPDGRLRLHLADTAVVLDPPTVDPVTVRLVDADRTWTARDLDLPETVAVELVRGLLRAGVVRREPHAPASIRA